MLQPEQGDQHAIHDHGGFRLRWLADVNGSRYPCIAPKSEHVKNHDSREQVTGHAVDDRKQSHHGYDSVNPSNSAEPTRISVAPSSMAISKSLVMPIDK